MIQSIKKIAEKALKYGYLTASMEVEINQLYQASSQLSFEECQALDLLMGSLLTKEVVSLQRKQFINVMEDLVLMEAAKRAGEVKDVQDRSLDIGDITAYALNRLPPLYATTEEGARFQKEHVHDCLQELIAQQVDEAIQQSLQCPEFHPERQGISNDSPTYPNSALEQISSLLQTCATNYAQPLEACQV